jgi:alpha-1,6-mannosyltransferase
MRVVDLPLPKLLWIAGGCYIAASLVLCITQTPLGSTLFFTLATVMAAAYGLVLARVWGGVADPPRLLRTAFIIAVLIRLPLALAPVGSDNDMVRYLWDGRVQHAGYNPYAVVPADPAMAHTHTAETAAMPSARQRTPYPPAAQLFFRLVTGVWDSTLGMKLALVACDLLTIVVLWRWLVVTDRNPWLALAYAWNPLVVLEVAHSGHIDALGALWITASAYWLARRQTALASIAFVFAVAAKLLPIVLAPLFLGRVRVRDILIGAALLLLLYLPFTGESGLLAAGAVPNVVAHIRFNGPVFRWLALTFTPSTAAMVAVLLGLVTAAYARVRLSANDPAAWGWPMTLSLLCAPVIYPWYLLYAMPFLFTRATLPITAWSISIIPVYVVWRLAREGGRWRVPASVLVVEYGVLLIACIAVVVWVRRRAAVREPLTL